MGLLFVRRFAHSSLGQHHEKRGLAHAAPPITIDLDERGVLEPLKLSHPQQYQAVTAILSASERMPYKSSELHALRVRFEIKDLECNLLVLTSWP